MKFKKIIAAVEQFYALAEEPEPETQREPTQVSPEVETEIGFKPTPDVFSFLKLLQVLATIKNKLSNHRDLDPYVPQYIGLIIQSKAGVYRNAIKDSIARNVFSFDDYEGIRSVFKDYILEVDLAGYLDMLLNTVKNTNKLSSADQQYFISNLEFILRELKRI